MNTMMTGSPARRSRLTGEAAAATETDPRWKAVLARDASVDGKFVYSVRSTGVYCRPSCAARRPRPENVRFHDSVADAERAGFRPCKRCKPEQASREERNAAMVADLCRALDDAETPPDLRQLAARAGVSPWHLHRVFKAVTGMTPRAYAAGRRAARMREALAEGGAVTNAIYAAGFGSSGRFYAGSGDVLGMRPSDYRDGGAGVDIRFALGQCALGAILVAATKLGICAIALGDEPGPLLRDLQDRFPNARLRGGDPDFERVVARVVAFVEAPAIGLSLPLDVRGTAFQLRVWDALRLIPAGERLSYAELARRLGMPRAARSVASACAANVLAVAIPCHRVVRGNGELSGYRWGVARKRALLDREAG